MQTIVKFYTCKISLLIVIYTSNRKLTRGKASAAHSTEVCYKLGVIVHKVIVQIHRLSCS